MGRTDSKAVFWSDSPWVSIYNGKLDSSISSCSSRKDRRINSKKKEIYDCYQQELGNVRNIKFVKEYKNSKSVHCYPSILLWDG